MRRRSARASSIARRWRARCATRRSSWASSKADRQRRPTRRWRWSSNISTISSARSWRARRGDRARPRRRWRGSTWRRLWPSSRSPSAIAGPLSTTALASTISERPPSGGRGGAARRRRPRPSSPMTATSREGSGCGSSPARTWRAKHLPAPERAHRHAGADGLLRAGRGGAHRHRRSAVQPRRRRRRSRARPLDLHGRDGRDRGDPQPGDRARPSSSSTRSAAAPRPSTGSSIAWATVEHLHDINRCRALFATHYHELTALAAKLADLACHTMRVKEWQGDVVFLHEVAPGAADRSYGIHVAKLAGLPATVIARAEEVLETLETGEQGGALARLADDLPLFAAARAAPPRRRPLQSRRRSRRSGPTSFRPGGARTPLSAQGLLAERN